MRSAANYLVTARQSEIAELERLAQNGELVGAVARFAHALQRERGITNIFLASHGERFAAPRVAQIAECDALQQATAEAFDRLADGGTPRNGARLFNRIAAVLHALDALPALRGDVAVHAITPRGATAAYVRLIAGLLAVVFEAADSAADPEISRALVALFNFMQGKEYAGQERAHGAAVFASGRIDAPALREWRDLIEQQQQAFGVFADFAEPVLVAAERASHDDRTAAQVERLRRTGWTLGENGADAGPVQEWYDCMTRRIDAMRGIEDMLASHLRALCVRRIEAARADLRDQQAMLARLDGQPDAGGGPPALGPQLERSVLHLVQEQSRRLQAMHDELEAVRATLNERKVIERAKGLLMAHRHLSEDEAYKALRQLAMNQKRRLADIAEAVLAMAEVLPAGPSR